MAIRPINSSRCRVSSSIQTVISGCWTRVRRRSRPTLIEGPKLVRVDLARNEIDRVVRIAGAAMTPTTYLNDVRFDFSNGAYAYITDSQPTGALIVVDLDTGESWDRLRGHRSTQAEDGFRAVVEGLVRDQYRVGADGIAISPTGDRLFYCPLSSRRLYSVDTAALRDREALRRPRRRDRYSTTVTSALPTASKRTPRATSTPPHTNTARCCGAARRDGGRRCCTPRSCCGPTPWRSPLTATCTSVSTNCPAPLVQRRRRRPCATVSDRPR